MALIIIGLIIFIVGLSLLRGNENLKRIANPVRIVGFVIILLGIVTACVIQIDVGQVGVKKLFGKVQDDVLTSGLHFINPLLEIERMDVKTQNYTMSGIHDEG